MASIKKYGRSDYTHALGFLPIIPICPQSAECNIGGREGVK
jgi:hypothetical protein